MRKQPKSAQQKFNERLNKIAGYDVAASLESIAAEARANVAELEKMKQEMEQKPMTSETQLQESFDKLSETVLRVKAERDALLIAAQKAYALLDDRYDVEQFTDGSSKEYPFGGAGEMMNLLKAAIDKAVR